MVRRPIPSLCALITLLNMSAHAAEMFPDLDAKLHAIPDAAAKATVLVFITNDCPISNAYAPELGRIHAAFSTRGVAFFMIYSDPSITPELARQHRGDFKIPGTTLIDAAHALAKKTNATTMPQAVVLSPEGLVLYRGRIDDRYVDLGKSRVEPTVRDLHDALTAILDNKPIPNPVTKAIGCDIPFAAAAPAPKGAVK